MVCSELIVSNQLPWMNCCSVTKSRSTLEAIGLQHTRFPCPPLSPELFSSSCPSSQWSCLTISPSAALFSLCLSQHQGSALLQEFYFLLHPMTSPCSLPCPLRLVPLDHGTCSAACPWDHASLEAGLQMVHGGSRLLGQCIKKLSPIGSRILGSRICLGEFIFAQTREPRVCSVL